MDFGSLIHLKFSFKLPNDKLISVKEMTFAFCEQIPETEIWKLVFKLYGLNYQIIIFKCYFTVSAFELTLLQRIYENIS